MGMVWNGQVAIMTINGELRRRIKNASIYWVGQAKSKMGVAGRKQSRRGTGGHAGVSKQGEYPRKQTGHLRRNISYEMSPSKIRPHARVGTNVKYGRWLEEGVEKINLQARPWMTRNNKETQTSLRGILEAGRIL